MIQRYSREQIAKIWQPENKYKIWLDIEIYAAEAMEKFKIIPKGIVFTIEPIINLGEYHTKVLQDGWTAVTKDKSLSAQFEHTVGINDNGYEIFTL